VIADLDVSTNQARGDASGLLNHARHPHFPLWRGALQDSRTYMEQRAVDHGRKVALATRPCEAGDGLLRSGTSSANGTAERPALSRENSG